MPLEGNGLDEDTLLSPTIAAHRGADVPSTGQQPSSSNALV